MFNPRKLLTATAGLATVSYLGTTSCGGDIAEPKGSGGAQMTGDGDGDATGTGGYYTSGNLVPPEHYGTGGLENGEVGTGGYYSSGNLMPPEYYSGGQGNEGVGGSDVGAGGEDSGAGGDFTAGNLLPPQPR